MTGPDPTHVFLSGVRASTHLVYAAAFLRHLLSTTSGPVTVFLIDAGGGFGHARVGAPEARDLLPDDPRLSIVTDPPSGHWAVRGGRAILLSIGAPGLRAFSRLVRANCGRAPKVVVVDEGLGSYGTWRTRRDAYRRQGGRGLWPTVRALAVTSGDRLLTDVRWSLYEERAGRWMVNEEVAKEFRQRAVGRPADHGAAVYISQPWPDIGIMSEAAYAAHLAQVRRACQEAGLDLVVRAHPSEPVRRHDGTKVTTASGPAELDRGVFEAPVLIGTQSTALLNLVAIHGSRIVRVAAPELEGLESGLAPRQRRLLAAFVPPPVPVSDLGAALREALGRG